MRTNIVFNYLSRLFTAFSSFLFVPFYISILGADGFSIISLSLVVVSVLMILDVGLSSAIAREVARRDISDFDRYRAFCAIEKLYLAIFGLVSLLGYVLADHIAIHLIKDTPISREIIAACLVVIFIEAGLQLAMRFYVSVLVGLEKQVQSSIFAILWAALRNGAVILAITVADDIYIFFLWQAAMTLLFVAALKSNSTRYTNAWASARPPLFDVTALRRVRGFAIGMVSISLVSVINTQLDKILVSALASMRELAAYSLSASLGTAILIAANPIMAAVQPRLTAHFTRGEFVEAYSLFLKASRVVALLVFPLAAVVSIESERLLIAWLGNVELAVLANSTTPYLVIANLLIALATLTYAVALSNGFTHFSQIVGITSLLFSIPGYLIALQLSGPVAVSAVYLAIQVVSTLVFSWLVMKQFFGGGFLRHHAVNIAIPAIASYSSAYVYAHLTEGLVDGRSEVLAALAAGFVVSALVTAGLSVTVWKLIDGRVSP